MSTMQFRHAIIEYIDVFLFSGVNKCLNVFSFVLFQHLSWKDVIFHLQ